MEEMFITRPAPPTIMERTAYFVSMITDTTFSRISASICAFGIVASMPLVPMPALLTMP